MAPPLVENVRDLQFEASPGVKIRVKRFVANNGDFIATDAPARREVAGFFGVSTGHLAIDQFYLGQGGQKVDLTPGSNLYVNGVNGSKVTVVHLS